MKYSSQPAHLKIAEEKRHGPFFVWALWAQRFKTRKQLRQLYLTDPDRLHDDLGLSSDEVMAEIEKPFWR